MAVRVLVQDESGKIEDEFIDETSSLARILPSADDKSFYCLRFIDPYGNTVFNGPQMELFLTEWERVQGRARSDLEKNTYNRVERMARRVQNDVHTYLKFEGD